MKDYYKILEISPNASFDVIKGAYRALVKKMHPDTHPDEDETVWEKTIEEVNEAYEVLSDEKKRAAYDIEWRLEFGAGAEEYYEDEYSSEEYEAAGEEPSNDTPAQKPNQSSPNTQQKLTVTIVSAIVIIAVRILDLPTWISVITAIIMIFYLSDILTPVLIKKFNTLISSESKWSEDDKSALQSFLALGGLQIMYVIFDIDNWLTTLSAVFLLLSLIWVAAKVVRIMFNMKDK